MKWLATFLLFVLSSTQIGVLANNFAGANSYFLYALSSGDRAAVLDAMQSANMKLLRVFITIVAQGTKGSSASAVNDLETNAVGSYDDKILGQIDTLASEAHARGMLVCVHIFFWPLNQASLVILSQIF
jgi:mannan endo-1,4-beta-mannosidase